MFVKTNSVFEDMKKFVLRRYTIDQMLGPELKRYTEEIGRRYQTPDGEFLWSVTTFLEKTKSKEVKQILIDWRDRVGDAEADRITQYSCDIGTRIHKMLENRLANDENWHDQNEVDGKCYALARSMEIEVAKHVSHVFMSESRLHSNILKLAGTVDCFCKWDGKLTVLDFKNSRRDKGDEDIEDYKVQVCCYDTMINELLAKINAPKRVEQGVILMGCHSLRIKTFKLNLDENYPEMYRRLEQFHKDNLFVPPPTISADNGD